MYFDFNNPLGTLIPSLAAMAASPAAFFRDLPKARTRINGLFLLSLTTLALGVVATVFHGFGWLFLLPVIWGLMLAAGWIWSGWMRQVAALAGGERWTRMTAFEIAGYTSLPLALSPVPWVGWLGLVFSLYLQVQALTARGAAAGRCWLWLGAPVAAAAAAFGWLWIKVIAPQLAG